MGRVCRTFFYYIFNLVKQFFKNVTFAICFSGMKSSQSVPELFCTPLFQTSVVSWHLISMSSNSKEQVERADVSKAPLQTIHSQDWYSQSQLCVKLFFITSSAISVETLFCSPSNSCTCMHSCSYVHIKTKKGNLFDSSGVGKVFKFGGVVVDV